MKHPIRLIVVVLFLCGLTGCWGDSTSLPRVRLEPIAEGFASPVALIVPNDGTGRLFVVDQTGLIWIISEGQRLDKPFLDIRDRIVPLASVYDERGLLGLAFHPEFARNGRFYISYSAPLQEGAPSEWNHTTFISEFVVSPDNPNLANSDSERVILTMDKPGYNYEAGHLAFGPDGYLYIATGDSVLEPASESGQYAQDTFSMHGKILRIDVDRTENARAYNIPPDNPFASGGGRPEVFAYGFRNPYRFSFDFSKNPRLFVADVGQSMMEEVDLVVSGGNYGWPIREGTMCFNSQDWASPLDTCLIEGLIDPIISYTHHDGISAIIGGMVYRGDALSGLYGNYIFGDWGRGDGRLFAANPRASGGTWEFSEITVEVPGNESGMGQLLGVGQDEDGELYLLVKSPGVGPVGDSGRVYKVVSP